MGAAAEPRVQVTLGDGAALLVEGVLIAGGLTVAGPPIGGAARIELHHSTLVPGLGLRLDGQPAFPEAASLRGGGPGALTLVLERSICGRVDLGASAGSRITASDSILDGTRGLGAALVADTAALVRSTVLGAVTVDALEDTADTLFSGRVTAPSGPAGGVSCCYLGELSSVPLMTSDHRLHPFVGIASQREGAAALSRTLSVIKSAWGESPAGFNGALLHGIGMVQIRYNGAIDQKALANKLAPYDVQLEPGQIILGGSFTRPVPASRGDTFHVDYGSMGSISCRFV